MISSSLTYKILLAEVAAAQDTIAKLSQAYIDPLTL
jgi:hypothetical protein